MSDHFTSSDEEMEEMVNLLEVPKTKDYFEVIVPSFSDEQYIKHFRLSRHVTEELADRFENSQYYHHQEGDSPKVSALKFLTVFLWFASNQSVSYRDVADRFNISESTLFKIIRRVTNFLSNLSNEIIVWPTEEEKIEIEAHFQNKNFPGVIGIIDGSHIRIDKPVDDSDSYLNRKHFYSIQAQVVCDHNRKIRDIFVGYPGSVHDARVFRNSPLFHTLHEKCNNLHLLGDSAYPCLPNLLTPFRDNGHLTRRQHNYNTLLSKNRYIIEHCFGIMKQKFRQLYHIKLRNIEEIVHFIRACAVLHNLSIEDDLHEPNIDAQDAPQNEVNNVEDNQDDRDGIRKRIEVMNLLPFIL